MSYVPAKIASAVFVTAAIGLGAVATGLPDYTAKAADGCVNEPKEATPQGKHWYYRIERGTGHKCWYLRTEIEQSARGDTRDAAPAEKPVQRRQDVAAQRSIADAHAELRSRGNVADAPQTVWPNPIAAPAAVAAPAEPAAPAAAPADDSAASAPVASRWPQAADVAPANAAPSNALAEPSSAAPAPEASQMVADAAPTPNADAAQQQQPAVPPPPVAAAPERNTGSIHQLLLVAFGALTLAGLTGNAVYRLGRRRKRNDWLRERSNWQSAQNPHNPPWVEPRRGRPASATHDLDGRDHDERDLHDLAALRGSITPAMREADQPDEHVEEDGRVEEIEDFLARLTRQLHEELETRGARSAHAQS